MIYRKSFLMKTMLCICIKVESTMGIKIKY
jgi:hypothetical protein